MKLRLPFSYYNTISYAGTALALIAFFMFVFLYVLSSITGADKAYMGLVIFILIPSFIILGLLLIPAGMILKIRKIKKFGEGEHEDFPVLNLNLPNHRNGVIIFTIVTCIFFFLSALGSYEAYHYTESNRFCGTLCHSLMIPEYTAYQASPHARVHCAECHIGTGASWWVKSKMSGLKQVYATLTNTYPKPVPTPIENLRPARETCEECHWPQKIYGKQQRIEYYYLADEENTRWEIDMLMNTGGGNPSMGQSTGIHWHINPDIKIEYITTDEKRETIPQVILTNKVTGKVTTYNNTDEPLDEDAEYTERRTMDCIDCHNRPSHIYNDPSSFVNVAIASGQIDVSLPMVKQAAIEACIQEYESTELAMEGIKEYLTTFYEENYPDAILNKGKLLKSIIGVQEAFAKNIFPEMNVTWEGYPNHIGHMTSNGCFRCHDDLHESDDGDVISKTCNDCHLITAQGKEEDVQFTSTRNALDFVHPVDIDGEWQYLNCSECHSSPPI